MRTSPRSLRHVLGRSCSLCHRQLLAVGERPSSSPLLLRASVSDPVPVATGHQRLLPPSALLDTVPLDPR